MNQFGTILIFELKNYFKNKIFVGVTILLVVLIAAVMFFPKFIHVFEDKESSVELEDLPELLLVMGDDWSESLAFWDSDDADTGMEEQFAAAFMECFPDYQVIACEGADASMTNIKEKIISGEAECAFVLESPVSYQYYVNNLSMYDRNTEIADELLQNFYQLGAMEQAGVGVKEAQTILTTQITHETTSLGKDQAQNFFYTYIMIFALYMVILLYGQMVATNVASEKSSRAMELLITSAKPVSMMFGKVIASCLAGLIQLVAIFGSAFLFYNINRSGWEGTAIIASIFDMPFHLLMFMLIFFMLGFFIYAFLYGAIGSTASKVEDINTSVMPLTMLFVIAFMVVVFSMSEGSVDNLAMMICSFVPFTSPMAMFTRIAMSTVPVYQIAISIVILVGSVIGVGVLAAKIYRVGVLLYGTTPKPIEIIKAIRRA